MQHGLSQLGAELADLAEFLGQFAHGGPAHVGVDDATIFFLQVIGQRTAEAAPLDGLSDHRRLL
jgi:hypothetical protein